MVDVGDLVLSSALPVLQVLLLCSVGAVARWKGWLTPEGSKSLGRLIFHIFIPALVISSLAVSVTREDLGKWWMLPVNVVVNVLLGFALGYITAAVIRTPVELRPHFVCCSAIGNLGNMPLVLVPAIARQSSAFTDVDEENGIAYVFVGMFVVIIAQFSVAYNLLRLPSASDAPSPEPWSSGTPSGTDASAERAAPLSHAPSFVIASDVSSTSPKRQPKAGASCSFQHFPDVTLDGSQRPGCVDSDEGEPGDDNGAADALASVFPPSAAGPAGRQAATPGLDMAQAFRIAQGGSHAAGTNCQIERGIAQVGAAPGVTVRDGCSGEAASAGALAGSATAVSAGSCVPHSGTPMRPLAITCPAPQPEQPASPGAMFGGVHLHSPASQRLRLLSRSISTSFERAAHSNAGQAVQKVASPLAQLLTPPVISIVIGIALALVPAVRDLFFVVDNDDNDNPPVVGPDCEIVDSEAEDADSAPLGFVGQALIRLGGAMIPALMMNLGASLSKGPGRGRVPARVIIALIVTRLVILPVLGAIWVLGTKAIGMWEAPDDMFTIVLLLTHAMPTALNMHVVAALHQNRGDDVATMLFWQYLACIVTVPVCIAVFLALVL